MSGDATLAPGEQTWRLSVQIRGGDGEYTFVDHFTGDGVAVATADRVVSVGELSGGADDTRFAGVTA